MQATAASCLQQRATTGAAAAAAVGLGTRSPASAVAPAEVASVSTTARDRSSLHTSLPPRRRVPSTQAILTAVGVPAILGSPAATPVPAATLVHQSASNPGPEAVTMRASHSVASDRSVGGWKVLVLKEQAEEAQVRESTICAIVPSAEREKKGR